MTLPSAPNDQAVVPWFPNVDEPDPADLAEPSPDALPPGSASLLAEVPTVTVSAPPERPAHDAGPVVDVESPSIEFASSPTAPRDAWQALAATEADLEAATDEAVAEGEIDEALVDEESEDAQEPEGVDEATAAALSIGHEEARRAGRGSSWTIPLLCAGIAVIACCVLIPQTDINRRMAWEREKLRTDLVSIRQQIDVNDKFLDRIGDDPNLAERLAQRQLRVIRRGAKVLELDDNGRGSEDMSPFHLVSVSPPPPMPPYQPRGGRVAELCYNPRTRLYLLGAGLGLLATGLVLGYVPRR